jgi:hypothetical protein
MEIQDANPEERSMSSFVELKEPNGAKVNLAFVKRMEQMADEDGEVTHYVLFDGQDRQIGILDGMPEEFCFGEMIPCPPGYTAVWVNFDRDGDGYTVTRFPILAFETTGDSWCTGSMRPWTAHGPSEDYDCGVEWPDGHVGIGGDNFANAAEFVADRVAHHVKQKARKKLTTAEIETAALKLADEIGSEGAYANGADPLHDMMDAIEINSGVAVLQRAFEIQDQRRTSVGADATTTKH